MFEDVKDTFSDMGDGLKNTGSKIVEFVKDNKMLCICVGGVGLYALYHLYRDKSGSDSEYVSTYAYVPTGYSGYPTASESVDYNSVVEQLHGETIDSQNRFYDETMSEISKVIEDMQTQNDKTISSIINDYESQISKYDESLSYIEEQRQKDKIILEMQNNSNLYNSITDPVKQKELHDKNIELGESLGARFDEGTGKWSNPDGTSLYDVTVKNNSNSGTTDKTVVINQMLSNSNAWKNTNDASKQKQLHDENVKLAESIGATFDDASGVWTIDGKNIYDSVDTKKKITNSTSTNKTPSSSSTSSNSSSTSSNKSSSGNTVVKSGTVKVGNATYSGTATYMATKYPNLLR